MRCNVRKQRFPVLVSLFLAALLAAPLLSSAVARPALASSHPQAAAPQDTIQLQLVASGLARPVDVTAPPGDRGRIFVVEKTGYVRIVTIVNGVYTLLATPFLNIDPLVGSSGNEQGLLGLAFHPDYASNGYFFLNYTDNSGDTVIARYTVSAGDPNQANPASAQVVLTVDQPYSNHNGGQLQFGPDGYLVIGLGDGGSGGDPGDRSQNPGVLLGKMLRIDVDSLPYTIPASNPFVGTSLPLDEIWALGVRNPWRYSFDRLTGDLWIGDVGQGSWEEIDLEPAGDPGGRNWGWRCKEGTHVFDTSGNCPSDLGVLDDPIYEYSHAAGDCSLTGGYVYRGSPNSSYFGRYLFADYCVANQLRMLTYNGSIWTRSDHTLAPPSGLNMSRPTSFGQDAIGNVYMVDDNNPGVSNSGEVYLLKLRPATCVTGNYDLNGDGQVTVLDIQLVAGDWRRADFVPDFDVDCNGVVNIIDVQKVASAWQS